MRPGDPPSAEQKIESTKVEDAKPEVMLVAMPNMKKVAEEERIKVDQENNSQRTIAGGVTEGGVEDSTPFESAQPVTNSSSKQGEGFVAGSHYVPVSNTERPLTIEREEGRYRRNTI
jgi:hypothetical protein